MLSSTLRASRARAYATVASSSSANVASINHGQPTSSVTVLVKAGSRYETKPGVAHCLKNFAFKDTEKRSALRTIRETELFGGVLSTSLSREYIALTADFLPGNEFARHEFQESVAPLVQSESVAAFNDPATLALDLAHGLAFRNGLGASLFASSGSSVTNDDVKAYASKVFSKDNVAFIGTGVDESLLQKLVGEHFTATGSGATSSPATKYFGGETRIAPSPESHSHAPQTVFIGFGSASVSPELAILSAYLDPTTSLKWGQSTSPLAGLVVPGTTIKSVYLPYSDGTLAGVIIQAHDAAAVKTAAVGVAKAISDVKAGSLKGDAFNTALAKARFRLASGAEERAAQVASIGSKILGGDKGLLESLPSALEKTDASAFSKAASSALSAKPTYVAIGNVGSLPLSGALCESRWPWQTSELRDVLTTAPALFDDRLDTHTHSVPGRLPPGNLNHPIMDLPPNAMNGEVADDTQRPDLPAFMVIPPSDVEQAALVNTHFVPPIVQRMYSPQTDPATSQNLQRDLFELQRRPEAWGLVVPFVNSSDPQVQFFGAHTAQVKIARDWDQWPIVHAQALRDMLLNLTAQAAAIGVTRVVMRKLYVAVSSLALRLCPLQPSLWQDWAKDTLAALLATPAVESPPDFLQIAVEEVRSADLLTAPKARMQASLKVALPFVMQLFMGHIPVRPDVSVSARLAWLKAAEAWVTSALPGDELTTLVPILIELLRDRDSFVGTCDVLEEIMSKSALSGGKGTKVLTDPLLQWIAAEGHVILQESLSNGCPDENSHAFCKLLLALGDHSTDYLISKIDQPLVQTFLKVILGFTGFPGWYGMDEEESEMTLQFWSAVQDSIIDSEFDDESAAAKQASIKALDLELVLTLVRKARWPTVEEGIKTWAKDQKEKFQNFRRDLGDTLINTYYVLRNDFFDPILPTIVELLEHNGIPVGGWEGVEAAIYSIKTIQEAVPVGPNANLERVFGPEILGKLPMQGYEQIRRTGLDLVGSYATWFHAQETPELLMNAMSYVVAAFSEPQLSLHAARALRDLCENNRRALSKHIDSFSNLYANLPSIPDTEKAKVLQAICSVIQALPLTDAIGPVEASEEARASTLAQLHALSGCAKGLTNNTDPLLEFSTEDEDMESIRLMEQARMDPRMTELRSKIIHVLTLAMSIWSADAEVGDAVSDLIKAITSLPSDNTLLSLPPGPVLELVCLAAQRQTTAVWLTLATMLTTQLDSATSSVSHLLGKADKTSNRDADRAVVERATAMLVQYTLTFLATPSAMENNPDVVRAFFTFLTTISNAFPSAIVTLPPPLASGLMECSIKGLTLPERYSLVDAAKFLSTFSRRAIVNPDCAEAAKALLKQHGPAMSQALLSGISGASPRSTIPNLVELLAILLAKVPEHRTWMKETLYSPLMSNPRLTREAKDKFLFAATAARSSRQTSDAANEFSLIARGLDGSGFGYASLPV
ncbi:hypothetical protein FRB90_005956 [Tulasnella sp. 427]|nr:hypothetical protein FRB90_005956 [Tulasnella sp. 427]